MNEDLLVLLMIKARDEASHVLAKVHGELRGLHGTVGALEKGGGLLSRAFGSLGGGPVMALVATITAIAAAIPHAVSAPPSFERRLTSLTVESDEWEFRWP
jgi:hypothetical protein